MAEKLGHDPVLCDKLIPNWELGCRRVTPGEGYLEAFTLPNVQLTTSSIRHVTKNSIITEDGREYLVDASTGSILIPILRDIRG
jgi:cation diffusion facilitator CzcD-associated flavoprotein CzcO